LNSIQDKGRYYKQGILEKEMRKILTEKANGIDSGEFVEKLREATGVSRGMIFAHIKKLVSDGEIHIERNKKDRRKAMYFPNIEKVKPRQSMSEGIEFINSLGPDLKFAQAEKRDKRLQLRCKVAFFTNQKDIPQQQVGSQAKTMANQLLLGMQQIATTYHLKPHFKQAYILSVEKKE
jgi:biotin operon repressor